MTGWLACPLPYLSSGQRSYLLLNCASVRMQVLDAWGGDSHSIIS